MFFDAKLDTLAQGAGYVCVLGGVDKHTRTIRKKWGAQAVLL